MRASLSFLATILAISSATVSVKRSSPSFAGTSNYYLHTLAPAEQATYISALKGYGTKVVRLWVPNYEDIIGSYNTGTLDAIDSVLSQLYSAGIKAIISPHDANLLPPAGSNTGFNGIDIYGSTYKHSDSFYNSSTAKAQYDARLASILNYKSPAFGKRWADLADVILAFDIQNEPLIASPEKLAANDPDDWICGRAGNMKTAIGNGGVKIATGGIGGSQNCCDHEFNIIDKALNCNAIDILSMHGYMTKASAWAYYIPKLCDQAATKGKKVMIEEWGVATDSSWDSVKTQAAVFNNAGVPWLYWMIIPGKSVDESCDVASSCGGASSCCKQGLSTNTNDDFEIGLTSSRADFNTLIHAANNATARQDWTGYIY